MAETANFQLPLLAPSQAQKHVTVNDALAIADAGLQLRLSSRTTATPPDPVPEGSAWAVPAGAVNAWAGQDGKVAIGANGGWLFVTPARGWRAFVVDESEMALHDGAAWRTGTLAISPGGAATAMRVVEFDHTIAAGASSTTQLVIANGEQVIGVTGRILSDITGTLTSWDLGVPGATNRYGNGLGLTAGSWIRGLSGAPVTYYADTPLELTAQGGQFAGGVVRLAVHLITLTPPDPA